MSFKKYLKGDYVIWLIAIFLLAFSIPVIYSSAIILVPSDKAASGSYSYNALLQSAYVAGGLLIMWLISTFLSPSWVVKSARVLVIASLIFSALVFVPNVGVNVHGAYRWIRIPGTTHNICPFDFLRLFIIVDLAAQLTKRAENISNLRIVPNIFKIGRPGFWEISKAILVKNTIPIFWPLIMALCIVVPNNLSTSAILVFMVLVMLFFGNVRLSEIGMIIFYGFLALLFIVWLMIQFDFGRGPAFKVRFGFLQKEKVENVAPAPDKFQSSDDITRTLNSQDLKDYQRSMSELVVASGGMFGKGPGNSTLRSQLPHAYDDCVFAFIVEEYGLVGSLFVVAAYLILLIRGGQIARRSKYYAFSLLSIGITIHICLTALINMAVSVGFGVTGQTLPLISKGGSSLLANSIALGILLAISACPSREEAKQ